MVMEQALKEKAPVPAEVWDLAAVEKEKVAVKVAARDKARDKAKDKAKVKVKVAAKPRGRAADRISEPL